MYEPLLIFSILFTVGAAVYLSNKAQQIKENEVEGFIGGLTKSNLWFVVDDFGVNSRRWVDFGARSSRDLNVGLLNITKVRCAVTQGADFNVRELFGRASVAQVIRENGGYVPDQHLAIPPYIWRAWARSALLAYCGGLYLDGFSLCLGGSFAPIVKHNDNLIFGLEKDPLSAGSYAGWAATKGSTPWLAYVEAVSKFIERGPQSWNSAKSRNQVATWNSSILAPAVKLLMEPEWSRLSDGTSIEIEDLFGSSLSHIYSPGPNVLYVPVDSEKLMLAVTYNWVLRMSSEQLMAPESHFIWAQLAQRVGKRDALV